MIIQNLIHGLEASVIIAIIGYFVKTIMQVKSELSSIDSTLKHLNERFNLLENRYVDLLKDKD